MRSLKCRDDATSERNVIVLDQNTIGKIKTMILAAPAAHRVLVNGAQAWNGFARVQDASLGPVHGVHELPRQGCDAAHALQKIQDHALTGENHAGVMADHSNRLPLVQTHSVEDLRMAGDLVVGYDGSVDGGEYVEDGGNYADARKDAVLFREHGGSGFLIRLHASVAGRVARGAILEQRVLQDRGEVAIGPVHKSVVSGKWQSHESVLKGLGFSPAAQGSQK